MSWAALASAVLPSLISAYTANNVDKNKDMSNLDANMEDFNMSLGQYKKGAEDRINPDSLYNKGVDKQITDTNFDSMGVKNMLSDRASNAGGVGGYSGIAAQNKIAGLNSNNADLMEFIRKSRFARQEQGYNMLDKASQGQFNLGELKMQRDMSMPQNDIGSLIQAGGQGLLDYYMDNPGGQGPLNVMNNLSSENFNSQLDGILKSFPGQLGQTQGSGISIGNTNNSGGYQPSWYNRKD